MANGGGVIWGGLLQSRPRLSSGVDPGGYAPGWGDQDDEPERAPEPTAEWVEMYPHTDDRGRVWRDFACSSCHCKWDIPENSDREPPAECPFCGAVMR